MNAPPDPLVLPGPFRQLGYVVSDLDQAITHWLTLGVGPFYVLRDVRQDAVYRGEPCTVIFSVAFANNGDLQIELIQPSDDSPNIYNEFLSSGQEGMHQLAWWAPDFDATLAAAQTCGWPVVWSGGGNGSARYAYLEPPAGPATIIEIMELNDSTRGMGKLVREASEGWDGSDPIRTFGR